MNNLIAALITAASIASIEQPEHPDHETTSHVEHLGDNVNLHAIWVGTEGAPQYGLSYSDEIPADFENPDRSVYMSKAVARNLIKHLLAVFDTLPE